MHRQPLPQARRERFCQLVYGGMMPAVAFVRAGYSAKSAASAASRMLKNVDIRGRLLYLWAGSARRVIARKRDILVAETVEGFATAGEFLPLIGMDRAAAEEFLAGHPHAAAVRELEFEQATEVEWPDGMGTGKRAIERVVTRIKRFKLADAGRARAQLFRFAGMTAGAGAEARRGMLVRGQAEGSDGNVPAAALVELTVQVEGSEGGGAGAGMADAEASAGGDESGPVVIDLGDVS
jgi:hypothetical protein